MAIAAVALSLAARFAAAAPAATPVPSRIITSIDVTDTVTLTGNTHPLAKPAADRGLAPADQQLGSMFIALRRSPTQERALARFNARQLDAASPDYHHWLQPQEFGLTYGPNDADISALTGWLKAAGLQIHNVSSGRISIEFSGTAAQVQKAFGVEMHRYLVKGASAIANDRDPRVPRAVSPVVAGIVGLNTFPIMAATPHRKATPAATSQAAPPAQTAPLARAAASGTAGTVPSPDLSVQYASNSYALMTPGDFATIYNVLPLWNASTPILGTGVQIAIVGDNDISLADIQTFQTIFGLPANLPTTQHVGTDPAGSSEYSTASLELAGAAAPGASLILVVPAVPEGGATVEGLYAAVSYIVNNNIAPIVEFGYSQCEKTLGTDNASFNTAWQMGATMGMSIVVASGDFGSAGCNYAQSGDGDTTGLQVSGIASSPFVTAVGGTDFAWQWGSSQFSTYWNAPSSPNPYESAKSYIPEVTWNLTCTNPLLLLGEGYLLIDGKPEDWPTSQDLCIVNDHGFYGTLLNSTGSGGGYSHCTALDSGGNCLATSGYAKPDWQRGFGVPADGRRDVPDVSLFASKGWVRDSGLDGPDPALPPLIPSTAILICYDSTQHSCTAANFNVDSDSIGYQTYGGTGAAAAYWAGILALVVQKQGDRQGLVNPTLYSLFNGENLTSCNTSAVAAGNSCVFYDISYPVTNGMACIPNSSPDCYVDPNSAGPQEAAIGILDAYTAGVGYDQTTGLGTVNVTNLVNSWSSAYLPPVPSSGVAMGGLVDYLGDGRSDFSVWRPTSGNFFIVNQQEGYTATQQWGLSTDVPVVGDFDGDGVTDFAVWRPSTGTWYIAESSTGQVISKQWGAPTDMPVVGDFDGDGKTDIAVWRPSTGNWYIIQSSNGAVVTRQWGASTDVPVAGDFDGDGKTDIAVWRPSTGDWYVIQSSNGQVLTKQWGEPTDVPVFGDFDGDGKTDIAVWRAATGFWYILQSSNGEVVATQWGESGDVPVPSDYNGSGKTNIAVWRPSTGGWYVHQGGNQPALVRQWGEPGDLAAERISH